MRDIYKPIATFAAEEHADTQTVTDSQFAFFTINVDNDNFIKEARLVAIDEDDSTVKELLLPENTSIHLPYGLKDFQLKSLYKIAQMEKASNPLPLIQQTLTGYFGVSTKNIFVLYNNPQGTPVYEWLTSPLTLFHFAFDADWTSKHITTNTSRLEMLSLARTIQKIPDAQKSAISILDNEIGSVINGIDNSNIITTDLNKLDSYIKKAFENKDLINEKANISIENATTTQGLAKMLSRIVTNMGGVVVDLQNSEDESTTTKIMVSDKKWLQSVTLQKIVKSLPNSQVETSSRSDLKSDISIILGKDYARFITGSSE